MAFRRTSAPERIAGDILGFSTADEVEESQSVLAKYFPELSLRIPAKGSRGGRLGRSTQTAEQQIKYTPQEMLTGGAAPSTVNINIPSLVQPTTPQASTEVTRPRREFDFTSQIEGLKKQLIDQSKLLEDFKTKKPFIPQTAEEQAKEQITNLYKNVLGRTPDTEGEKFWLSDTRATGGITPQEYTTLEQDFKLSPEYNVLRLYREELGRTEDPRTADPEGFKYWTTKDPRSLDRMITGQEYSELQQAFRSTPEYQKKFSQTGSGASAGSSVSSGSASSSAASTSAALAPTRNFTPENPNPQTPEEAVKYLYQTQLGRTPSQQEAGYWLGNAAFADKGLTPQEWSDLTAGFQASPEYASLRR